MILRSVCPEKLLLTLILTVCGCPLWRPLSALSNEQAVKDSLSLWWVCAAWKSPHRQTNIYVRSESLSSFPTRSPTLLTVHAGGIPPHCAVIIQCNCLDLQHSFLFFLTLCLFVRAQEVDDVARVSEAVTKAVVCALKRTPSDDNTDDWLNPTEVVNQYIHINYSLKPVTPWLLTVCICEATVKHVSGAVKDLHVLVHFSF